MDNKRKISKNTYNLILHELKYLEKQEIITASQVESCLSSYEKRSTFSFIRVILSIASLLIGLGILTFIASNWQELTSWNKFILLIFFLASSSIASIITEENYPKTSRSLVYLSILIFGGGIFLVQQIFNITFSSTTELLIWGLAILPIAYIYRDVLILIFSQMLIFSFLLTFDMPLIILILLFALYIYIYHLLNLFHNENLLSSLALAASSLGFIAKLNIIINTENYLIFLIFFILGLIMVSVKNIKLYNTEIINSIGVILILFTGIFLTIDSTYYTLESLDTTLSLIFTFLYSLLLLYWLKKGRIYSIILICSVILRFYFDLSLKFTSKSLVFIVAGLILGVFGFWFEKQRKGGISHDEH